MVKRKQKKTKHKFICSPNDMLIVVDTAQAYSIGIVLSINNESIRTIRQKIEVAIPSTKRMREMVKEFCEKFVNQKYYSDPEVAEHAEDISSVTDIYGLKVWKRKIKRGLDE